VDWQGLSSSLFFLCSYDWFNHTEEQEEEEQQK
jgi:hypothetical protein